MSKSYYYDEILWEEADPEFFDPSRPVSRRAGCARD
jgi:hypothetical protein